MDRPSKAQSGSAKRKRASRGHWTTARKEADGRARVIQAARERGGYMLEQVDGRPHRWRILDADGRLVFRFMADDFHAAVMTLARLNAAPSEHPDAARLEDAA